MPKRTADPAHRFLPELDLAPSRLYAAWLALVFAAGAAAALVSNHPPLLKTSLLLLSGSLLLAAWRYEQRHGLRELSLGPDGQVAWVTADGRVRAGACAGHALVGTWVILVYVEQPGWRGRLGPARLAVFRDAADPDAWRRLRVRLRFGD